MNTIPLALYLAALVAYVLHFARRQANVGRAATTLLVAGALSHTFVVGMQTMEVGHVPVTNASSAISTFVLLLVLAYLYTEMTTEERAMGAFILPLAVALQFIPALHPMPEDRADVLHGPMFGIHVSSLLFAYASFALACVIGITYVLLFKEIKAKHLGFFYARLPSLQVLDVMNGRVVTIGWIFLTIGIAVGGIWATQVQGSSSDPRVQAMSPVDPKILVALVSWGVYSFALFARRAIGWSGRRAAWLSALAFVIVLLNFVPVGYFLTKSHNF
jgi:ABC-type transport system involved in cytochrome c biogenesis permease subunit